MSRSSSDLKKDIPEIDRDRVSLFQSRLLDWFKKRGRKFPWREPWRTPYEVLIAEIMLQKTRAENVVDTYLEFVERYPNFEALSNATLSELSKILEVLGLSKIRAKSLSKLSKEIVRITQIPRKREELLKLPGIGPYIANAFLLYAYGERLPIVDTNVKRLYERLFSFRSGRDARRDKRAWVFAESLLPKTDLKDFNWAIMDFCASICKAKNPLCPICFLNDICDYGRAVLALAKK